MIVIIKIHFLFKYGRNARLWNLDAGVQARTYRYTRTIACWKCHAALAVWRWGWRWVCVDPATPACPPSASYSTWTSENTPPGDRLRQSNNEGTSMADSEAVGGGVGVWFATGWYWSDKKEKKLRGVSSSSSSSSSYICLFCSWHTQPIA